MKPKKIARAPWPEILDEMMEEEDETFHVSIVQNGYILETDDGKRRVAEEVDKLCDTIKQYLVERKLKGKK